MNHRLRQIGAVRDVLRLAVGLRDFTVEDEFRVEQQTENLQKIADSCSGVGIQFTWEYDTTGTRHDRDITTDTGWKILLSRGLDVFQRFEMNDAFSFSNRLPQLRPCKEFNVTFVRIDDINPAAPRTRATATEAVPAGTR